MVGVAFFSSKCGLSATQFRVQIIAVASAIATVIDPMIAVVIGIVMVTHIARTVFVIVGCRHC